MKTRLICEGSSVGGLKSARGRLPEKGSTFIEIAVSVAMLGFVTASLYGAFSSGFCLIQTTRENLRATQIMIQKTEAIRLFTWTQICDTNQFLKASFVEPYDPLGATNGSSGSLYTGVVSARIPAVGDVPEAYRTNMRTITVTVYWTNYSGRAMMAHKRVMQTRVARNGMQNYVWGNL